MLCNLVTSSATLFPGDRSFTSVCLLQARIPPAPTHLLFQVFRTVSSVGKLHLGENLNIRTLAAAGTTLHVMWHHHLLLSTFYYVYAIPKQVLGSLPHSCAFLAGILMFLAGFLGIRWWSQDEVPRSRGSQSPEILTLKCFNRKLMDHWFESITLPYWLL